MSLRYGLGESTWQALERDGRLPKTETLMRLAQDGISIDWLVTGEGTMMRGGPTGDMAREPPPADLVSPTLAVEAWRRMLIITVRVFQSEQVDLCKIDPEKFAKVIDAMVEADTRKRA